MRPSRFSAIVAAVLFSSSLLLSPAAHAGPSPQQRVDEAFNRFGGKYNVITFRVNRPHNTSGLVFAQDCSVYDGFKTVVFVSGTFVRAEEGGYSNWAFKGSFTRGTGDDENRVVFHVRTYTPRGIQGC